MRKSAGKVMVTAFILMVLRTPSAQGVTVIEPSSTTTVPPTCTTPFCEMHIGCVLVPGPDGCPTCSCSGYNCDDITCGPDQECVMENVECPPDTTPCYPQPRCIPPYDTTTLYTPTSIAWCPMVTCFEHCQTATDSNGCTTCVCPPSCADTQCAEGEHCELLPTPCYPSDNPCFPQPVCVPTTETTTIIITTPATTTPCKLFDTCSCDTFQDSDGCYQCTCPYSCENHTCDPGQRCILQEFDECPTDSECFPLPTCVPYTETTTTSSTTVTTTTPCPIVTCGPFCGYDLSPEGCLICGCSESSCKNVRCSSGHVCVDEDVKCPGVTTSCLRPRCIPLNETTTTSSTTLTTTTLITTTPCTAVTCGPFCSLNTGPDGCPICGCSEITCANVRCISDHVCVDEEVECPAATTSCLRPRCIPLNDSCTGTPNTKLCSWPKVKVRWFYNSSANTCKKFSYYGCSPSHNTFLSRKACESTCKRTDQPICTAVACDDCYTFTAENQCPRCICPNPCKDFKCGADEQCKLREATCSEDLCTPEPFCAA